MIGRITVLFFLVVMFFSAGSVSADDPGKALSTPKEKEQFAREMSFLIERTWKSWQDSVLINGIDVEGSRGILSAGDVKGPGLKAADVVSSLEGEGKSREYVDCAKTVARAVGNAMGKWQRGYMHDNIPFPQGASCVYALPPCHNVPVSVGSGRSLGDSEMTEDALYGHMLYVTPHKGKDALVVLRGSAGAFSECFIAWKRSCSIIGILASGGIAPQPAPMGPGPGLVRGAEGNGGKFVGPYFDGELMYSKMVEHFKR